ncbi:hypothetical protein ABZ960_04400 [Streptomyces pseudovenezuelae]|uniref:hypothetical protein n=1 Tax=Streptomyces pseudovenezuelae TaxID=67350 RepID=UPI0034A3EBC8
MYEREREGPLHPALPQQRDTGDLVVRDGEEVVEDEGEPDVLLGAWEKCDAPP